MIFSSVLLVSTLFAQSAGKISGRVIDAETGTPLPGANVMVNELETGSSADLEGNFAIMRIYPGKYTLKITFIGYAPLTINDVRVSIDKTTFVDALMKVQGIETQEVVVTAQRPVVDKDKTFSSSSIESDDMKEIPMEGLRDVLDLNTSLERNANGTYSLRGGGSFDINFMIDGVTQENSNSGVPGTNYMGEKSNTSWKFDFNPLGVKQMELISGGFSAEYGNAQSGVVKVATKEGTSKFHGDIRVEVRPAGQYHFGDYLYSKKNFEWQKWGNLSSWFNAAEFLLPESEQIGNPYTFNSVRYNRYIYDEKTGEYQPYSVSIRDSLAASYYNMWAKTHTPEGSKVKLITGYDWVVDSYLPTGSDSIPIYRKQWKTSTKKNGKNNLGVYDYRDISYVRTMFGFGGPIGKLQGWTFFLSGERREKPTRLPTYEKTTLYENFNLTTVSKFTEKFRIRSMMQYQHNRGGIFSGSDDIRWASPIGNVSFHTGQQKYLLSTVAPKDEFSWIQSMTMTYVPRSETFYEATFSHTYERYEMNTVPLSTKSQVAQGSWDEGYTRLVWDPSGTLYNQDSRTHTWAFKSDFTHQFNSLNHLKGGIQGTLWNMHYNSVSSVYANAFVYKSGFAEWYEAAPYYFAAYFQDKMEYKGLIANIGVRAEGYNMNLDMPVDEYYPFYQGTDGASSTSVGNPETKKPSTHYALSPRLGLSFPIGERTAFRLQYGHFYAMPIFRHTISRSTWGGWIMYGNPDLDFRKTVSYEFGIQHSLMETHRLDIVAYYNDRTKQTVNIRRHFSTGSYLRSAIDPYAATYVNNGYGATKGIEISLDKITPGRWKYRLKYSLSRTSAGAYGATEIWAEDDPKAPYDMRIYISRNNDNITSEDKTHSFSAFISYTFPTKSGIHFRKIYPFQNLTAAMSYTAKSGIPFTYVTSYDEFFDVSNNRRYPIEYATDLSISKDFKIAGYIFTFACRIQNLFNNKWLTPFDSSVETDDMQRWVETGMTWDNPEHPNYNYNYFRVYRNTPREIFFTVGIGF